jgi:hypothetical protein
MKNPQDLIGRKVRGFKFETDNKENYNPNMDKHIGEIGEIIKQLSTGSFQVKFKEEYWNYPADQIEAHLVDEEIPTLSDGVMMLVSDDEVRWYSELVFGKIENFHISWNRAGSYSTTYWKYAKPLEPTKEEQLTAILGSSDKVAEIMELFKKE